MALPLIGAGFGVALRRLEPADRQLAERAVGVAFKAVTIVLHWVIELVPRDFPRTTSACC